MPPTEVARCVSKDASEPTPTPRRLASPMSASFPRRCGVTSTFWGFKSRCTMPRLCNACNPSHTSRISVMPSGLDAPCSDRPGRRRPRLRREVQPRSHRSAVHHRRQRADATLQRDVHKIRILLHREESKDVGVRIRRDQRRQLGAGELVELREEPLDGDGPAVQLALEHYRPARTVAEDPRADGETADADGARVAPDE